MKVDGQFLQHVLCPALMEAAMPPKVAYDSLWGIDKGDASKLYEQLATDGTPAKAFAVGAGPSKSLTYGEVTEISMEEDVFPRCYPQPGDVIDDLGGGTGKPALTLGLLALQQLEEEGGNNNSSSVSSSHSGSGPAIRARSIELATSRHDVASRMIEMLKTTSRQGLFELLMKKLRHARYEAKTWPCCQNIECCKTAPHLRISTPSRPSSAAREAVLNAAVSAAEKLHPASEDEGLVWRAVDLLKKLASNDGLQAIHGDILKEDMSETTIVFCNNTVFEPALSLQLFKRLQTLPKVRTIILLRPICWRHSQRRCAAEGKLCADYHEPIVESCRPTWDDKTTLYTYHRRGVEIPGVVIPSSSNDASFSLGSPSSSALSSPSSAARRRAPASALLTPPPSAKRGNAAAALAAATQDDDIAVIPTSGGGRKLKAPSSAGRSAAASSSSSSSSASFSSPLSSSLVQMSGGKRSAASKAKVKAEEEPLSSIESDNDGPAADFLGSPTKRARRGRAGSSDLDEAGAGNAGSDEATAPAASSSSSSSFSLALAAPRTPGRLSAAVVGSPVRPPSGRKVPAHVSPSGPASAAIAALLSGASSDEGSGDEGNGVASSSSKKAAASSSSSSALLSPPRPARTAGGAVRAAAAIGLATPQQPARSFEGSAQLATPYTGASAATTIHQSPSYYINRRSPKHPSMMMSDASSGGSSAAPAAAMGGSIRTISASVTAKLEMLSTKARSADSGESAGSAGGSSATSGGSIARPVKASAGKGFKKPVADDEDDDDGSAAVVIEDEALASGPPRPRRQTNGADTSGILSRPVGTR